IRAQRTVAIAEAVTGVGVDDSAVVAPAEKGQDLRCPLVDGVVRRVACGAEVEQVSLGQARGMAASDVSEQALDRGPVVVGRLCVAIGATEVVEDGGARRVVLSRDRSKTAAFP